MNQKKVLYWIAGIAAVWMGLLVATRGPVKDQPSVHQVDTAQRDACLAALRNGQDYFHQHGRGICGDHMYEILIQPMPR